MNILLCLLSSDDEQELSSLKKRPKLKELLQFITGQQNLPRDGQLIKVQFFDSTLPDAESCFKKILLPTLHTTHESFQSAMTIAVNCQHQGYGRG